MVRQPVVALGEGNRFRAGAHLPDQEGHRRTHLPCLHWPSSASRPLLDAVRLLEEGATAARRTELEGTAVDPHMPPLRPLHGVQGPHGAVAAPSRLPHVACRRPCLSQPRRALPQAHLSLAAAQRGLPPYGSRPEEPCQSNPSESGAHTGDSGCSTAICIQRNPSHGCESRISCPG